MRECSFQKRSLAPFCIMQRVARLGIGLKSFIAPGELKGVAITKVNQNSTYYNINKICSIIHNEKDKC